MIDKKTMKNLKIAQDVELAKEMTAEAFKSPLFLDLVAQYEDQMVFNEYAPLKVCYEFDGNVLAYHKKQWELKGKPKKTFWKYLDSEMNKIGSILVGKRRFYLFKDLDYNNDTLTFTLSEYGYQFFNGWKKYISITTKERQILNLEASKARGYQIKAKWFQEVKTLAPTGTQYAPIKIVIDLQEYQKKNGVKVNTDGKTRKKHFNMLVEFFEKVNYKMIWTYKKGFVNVLITQTKKGKRIKKQGATIDLINSFEWTDRESRTIKKDFIDFYYSFLANNDKVEEQNLKNNTKRRERLVKEWYKHIKHK